MSLISFQMLFPNRYYILGRNILCDKDLCTIDFIQTHNFAHFLLNTKIQNV